METIVPPPYADSTRCPACDEEMIPLTSSLPESAPDRPDLKCAKCGATYLLRMPKD